MTDKTMTLEPCPFCGGEAKAQGGMDILVRCCLCGATGTTCRTEEDAIAAWNTRHLSQTAERGEAVADPSPCPCKEKAGDGRTLQQAVNVVTFHLRRGDEQGRRALVNQMIDDLELHMGDHWSQQAYAYAQIVDVAAVREVIVDLRIEQKPTDPAFELWADKLARAIGDAK